MVLFIFLFLFFLLLSTALLFLPLLIKEGEGSAAALEAGFFSAGRTHLVFSLQFVFLMLVFIVFDTELLLVFGLVLGKTRGVGIGLFLLFFLFATFGVELC